MPRTARCWIKGRLETFEMIRRRASSAGGTAKKDECQDFSQAISDLEIATHDMAEEEPSTIGRSPAGS